MRAIALIPLIALIGCTDEGQSHSEIINKQIGRFAFMPAQEGYPPMILDTAAGCVMAIAKEEKGGVSIDEVNFPDGPSSCNAMKQLLVVDTLSKVNK